MTELEKIQHLGSKYAASKRLYTVYSRTQVDDHYTFTLIYGTDKKKKAQAFVQTKEQEGLFLIVYCANLKAQHSRCVFVSGMQNSLIGPPVVPETEPVPVAVEPSSVPVSSVARG